MLNVRQSANTATSLLASSSSEVDFNRILFQFRNEVCRIKDQKGGIRDK